MSCLSATLHEMLGWDEHIDAISKKVVAGIDAKVHQAICSLINRNILQTTYDLRNSSE